MLKTKPILTIFVLFLASINVFLFAKTVVLGDEILKIEKKIKKVQIENSELEKRLNSLNSLQNIAKLASDLGFTKKTEPLFIENFNLAQKN